MDFQIITSSQNNRIKELAKLNLPKYRRDLGLFMVENLAIIRDALASGFDFEALFITEDFYAKNKESIEFIKNHSQSKELYLINEKLNQSYSELSTPSGITAIYQMRGRELSDDSVVYLDGVSDPGNLGTIMRSALAFGLENLVLSKECADIYNAKTIAAAKDAIFKLKIIEDREGAWLKECSLPILATSSHEGALLGEFKLMSKFCLVLGSESHGVSKEIMERADQKIKIAISNKIESLNVATAAAILFYELKK